MNRRKTELLGKPVRPIVNPISSSEVEQRSAKVVLDWRAYFYEFCLLHGEPVQYKGRLLFRDGWTYSATDHQGPEWEPSEDHNELDKMIMEYWSIRRSQFKRMLKRYQHELKTLKDAQATRQIPLQQITHIEDSGRYKRSHKALDTSGIEARIEWLAADIRECDERLREIEEYHKRINNERSSTYERRNSTYRT